MADRNEFIPEPPRPKLTALSAHPALRAASDYAGKCAAVERERFGTRAYYDALAACDAAWERIAVACGVTGRAHELYTDADKDRPDVICDSNGQVTLGLCKVCGRGEAELEGPCPGTRGVALDAVPLPTTAESDECEAAWVAYRKRLNKTVRDGEHESFRAAWFWPRGVNTPDGANHG